MIFTNIWAKDSGLTHSTANKFQNDIMRFEALGLLVVMRRRSAPGNRRFGTDYRSHFQGWSSPRIMPTYAVQHPWKTRALGAPLGKPEISHPRTQLSPSYTLTTKQVTTTQWNISNLSKQKLWLHSIYWKVICRMQRFIFVQKKNQRDATEWFIALIIFSTFFGHFYAHHQELETIQSVPGGMCQTSGGCSLC